MDWNFHTVPKISQFSNFRSGDHASRLQQAKNSNNRKKQASHGQCQEPRTFFCRVQGEHRGVALWEKPGTLRAPSLSRSRRTNVEVCEMRLSAVGQVHFKRGEALCFYEQCIHYDSVIIHPRFGVGRSVIWRGDFITSGASTCRGFLEFSTLQGSSNDSFNGVSTTALYLINCPGNSSGHHGNSTTISLHSTLVLER